MLNKGFYTALGTALADGGELHKKGMTTHLEQQVAHGAAGLLLMGSMGQQAGLRFKTTVDAVKLTSEVVGTQVPVLVGCMDISVGRVRDRVEAYAPYASKIEGLVFTAPYYSVLNNKELINYFTLVGKVLAENGFNMYLYDLPGVVKHKITFPMMQELRKNIPNLKGIKSGDTVLVRQLLLAKDEFGADFTPISSNMDMFDVQWGWGVDRVLDGMFASCPKNSKKMVDCLSAGDYEGGAKALNNILALRDGLIVNGGIMPGFTYLMNLIGCEGTYNLDYAFPISEQDKVNLKALMEAAGEI